MDIPVEALARNIMADAIWHREHCGPEVGNDCNVSLMLLGEAYVRLMGRPLSPEEKPIFV